MGTLFKIVSAGLAASTILAGTAVSASAQSETIKDKRADVVRYDTKYTDSREILETITVLDAEASRATGIDATSTTVKHGKKTIRVTIRFSHLSTRDVTARTFLRTSAKGRPVFRAHVDSSHKNVYVYDTTRGKRTCIRPQSYKRGAQGQITFTIPRSCIGSPKSFKASSTVSRLLSHSRTGDSLVVESLSSTAFKTAKWTRWLKSS